MMWKGGRCPYIVMGREGRYMGIPARNDARAMGTRVWGSLVYLAESQTCRECGKYII